MTTYRSALYRDFQTQAQIDAQYNAGMSVENFAAYGRHFAESSARTREQLKAVLDVQYGPTRDETLDIFPAANAGAPVFVFMHGGYWCARSSKDFSCVALGLQAVGVTTVVIDYALCPKVTIEEITRQARAAVAWVLRNISEYGGDADRVAVGGHSAGAHLAAMVLQTHWVEEYGLPADPLRAALLVSGLYDLRPLRYSYLQPSIQLDERVIQRCSPLFSVRPCRTPIWVTWGENESAEFTRQSASFHGSWLDVGNTAKHEPQPGADHFSAIYGFEDSKSTLCQWLAEQLLASPHSDFRGNTI
jgi:arylformamidase